MGPAEPFPSLTTDRLKRLAPLGFAQYIDGIATHGYYDAGTCPRIRPSAATGAGPRGRRQFGCSTRCATCARKWPPTTTGHEALRDGRRASATTSGRATARTIRRRTSCSRRARW